MGQYYKPCSLSEDKKEVVGWMYTHDYGNGLNLLEHSYLLNNFVRTVEKQISPGGEWNGKPLVWVGDYSDDYEGNLYAQCNQDNNIKPEEVSDDYKLGNYLVNHTKKEYVDKTKIPNEDGWAIHPLPLLTCEGNGRGGGDFMGEDPNHLVGSWARDIITVESIVPLSDYTELIFDLKENW